MVTPVAVSGPLRSELLRGNDRLQKCAQLDPSHVQPDDPQSDHVRLIQEALRQVANATIPAGEKNYGTETVTAVVAFKTDRNLFTRGTTTIDPIVGIGTIRKLDELLQADDERRRRRGGNGEIGVFAVITPDTPVSGETNLRGFSAARLAHLSSNTEWTRRDPFKAISQMVPVGQTRKLLVKGFGGAAVSFSINRDAIATIAASDQGSVTVRGNAPGTAVLSVSVEGGQRLPVTLVVRGAASLAVDVFHLGPAGTIGPAAFQSALLPVINAVYGSQANVTFTAGGTGEIRTMVMDGSLTAIDADTPLFFSSVIGPPIATRPTFRFGDLQREAKNPAAITIFISPKITDQENANVAGRGGIRTKVAWFKTGLRLDASNATIPSHEIGHSLGLQHITVGQNETFLMNPTVQKNNLVIPSETLEDLMPL
jgi:hypothetical protein